MHTDAKMPQKLLSGLYQGWRYSCFVKYHYLVLGIRNMSSNLFQSFWNILLAWNGAERTFKTNETRQQTLAGRRETQRYDWLWSQSYLKQAACQIPKDSLTYWHQRGNHPACCLFQKCFPQRKLRPGESISGSCIFIEHLIRNTAFLPLSVFTCILYQIIAEILNLVVNLLVFWYFQNSIETQWEKLTWVHSKLKYY
jgi:hypothetical protein